MKALSSVQFGEERNIDKFKVVNKESVMKTNILKEISTIKRKIKRSTKTAEKMS